MANWSRSDKFFWEQKKRAAKYAAEEKKKRMKLCRANDASI